MSELDLGAPPDENQPTSPDPGLGGKSWTPPEITDDGAFNDAVGSIKSGFREKYGAFVSNSQARRIALGDPSEKGKITSRIKTLKREKEEHSQRIAEGTLTGTFNTGRFDEKGEEITERTLAGSKFDYEKQQDLEETTGMVKLGKGYLTGERLGLDLSKYAGAEGLVEQDWAFVQNDLNNRFGALGLTEDMTKKLMTDGTLGEIFISSLAAQQVGIAQGHLDLAGDQFDLATRQQEINQDLAELEVSGEAFMRKYRADGTMYYMRKESLQSQRDQLAWAEARGYFDDGTETLKKYMVDMDDQTKRDIVFGYDEIYTGPSGQEMTRHIYGTNEMSFIMQTDSQRFSALMRDGGLYIDPNTGQKTRIVGSEEWATRHQWDQAEIDTIRREGGEISVEKTRPDGQVYFDVMTVHGEAFFNTQNLRLSRIFANIQREDIQAHELATMDRDELIRRGFQEEDHAHVKEVARLDRIFSKMQLTSQQKHDRIRQELVFQQDTNESRLSRIFANIQREDIQAHELATMDRDELIRRGFQEEDHAHVKEMARLDRIFSKMQLTSQQKHDLIRQELVFQQDMIREYGGYYVDEDNVTQWADGTAVTNETLVTLQNDLGIKRDEAQLLIQGRLENQAWIRSQWLEQRKWEHEDDMASANREWQFIQNELDRDLQATLQADVLTSKEGIAAMQVSAQRRLINEAATREQWSGIMSFVGDVGMESLSDIFNLGEGESLSLLDVTSWGQSLWDSALGNGEVTQEVFDKASAASNVFTSVPSIPLDAGGWESTAATTAAATEGGVGAGNTAAVSHLGSYGTTALQWAGPAAMTVYMGYRAWGQFKKAQAMDDRFNDKHLVTSNDDDERTQAKVRGVENWSNWYQGLTSAESARFRGILDSKHGGKSIDELIDEDGNITSAIDWTDENRKGQFSEALIEFMGPDAFDDFANADGRNSSWATIQGNHWSLEGSPLADFHMDAQDVTADVRKVLDMDIWSAEPGSVKGNQSQAIFAAWQKLPHSEVSDAFGTSPPDSAEGIRMMLQDIANFSTKHGIARSDKLAETYQEVYTELITANNWEDLRVDTQNKLTMIWDQLNYGGFAGGGFDDAGAGGDYEAHIASGGRVGEDPESNNNILRMFQNRRSRPADGEEFFIMPQEIADVILPNGIYINGSVLENGHPNVTPEQRRIQAISTVATHNDVNESQLTELMDVMDTSPELNGDMLLNFLMLPQGKDVFLPQDIEAIFGEGIFDIDQNPPDEPTGRLAAWDLFKQLAETYSEITYYDQAMLDQGYRIFGRPAGNQYFDSEGNR